MSRCHQELTANLQKPPASNSKQPTFAAYACSHATIGEFVPNFAAVLKNSCQIFTAPNFAIPTRTPPPPPPRAIPPEPNQCYGVWVDAEDDDDEDDEDDLCFGAFLVLSRGHGFHADAVWVAATTVHVVRSPLPSPLPSPWPPCRTPAPTAQIHNEKPPAQTIVWSIFIALASLVLVQKFFVYVIYKAMIQREWVDVGWLYNRRQVGKNVWTYSAGLWRKEVTVQYKGEVNERGLPHGMGHWTDGDFHGEHLCGLFREGVPVGPFTSAEQGTNFTFTNVRIGIVQCRAEQEWGQKKWTPAHRELQFGIGGVTACTSGIFYTHFPIPQQITPLLTAAQCEVYYRDPDVFPGPKRVASHAHNWFAVFVDQIQHLAGQDMPLSVVVAADPELGLVVEGFHPVQAGAAVQISVEDPPGAAEHDHTEEVPVPVCPFVPAPAPVHWGGAPVPCALPPALWASGRTGNGPPPRHGVEAR